jgi:hypothetical protein
MDLYVWKSPRDLDADQVDALVEKWRATGGDPGRSPFEPSTDVGWFVRELMKDLPELETLSDELPSESSTPIWLATTQEAPARVAAINLSPATPGDALEVIFGLATKYDLIVYDARNRRIHRPFEDMAEEASATFWPAGAIQAAVVGGAGGVIAVVAWILAVPLLSGLGVLIGGFLFIMAVYTVVHEGRKGVGSRRRGGEGPPSR